jgi:hypothetical protein
VRWRTERRRNCADNGRIGGDRTNHSSGLRVSNLKPDDRAAPGETDMDDIDRFSLNLFYYAGSAMPMAAPERSFKAPILAKVVAWIPAKCFRPGKLRRISS